MDVPPPLATRFGLVTDLIPNIGASLEAAGVERMLLVSRECHTLFRTITPSRILVTDPDCVQGLQVPWKHMPLLRRLSTAPLKFAIKPIPSSLVIVLSEREIDGAEPGVGNTDDVIKQRRPLEYLSLFGRSEQLVQLERMVRSPEQLSTFKCLHTLMLGSYGGCSSLDFLGALQPGDLPSVRSLKLVGNNSVSIRKIAQVFSLLESLQLSVYVPITDWTNNLKAMEQLIDLGVEYDFDHIGFDESLAGLTKLQRLMYGESQPTQVFLDSLGTLSGLRCLSLPRDRVNPDHQVTEPQTLRQTDNMHDLTDLSMPGWPCLSIQPRIENLSKLRAIHVHDTAVLPQEVLNHLTSLKVDYTYRGTNSPPMPRWSCPELREFTGSLEHMGCVVGSPLLTFLKVTPNSHLGDRHPKQLFDSLDLLQLNGGVAWPDLTHLIIQHSDDDGILCIPEMSHEGRYLHLEEFVHYLSQRERQLKHFGLFLKLDNTPDLITLIGGFTSLSSVTLVKTRVMLADLRMLVNLPQMETVELINVKCIDQRGVDKVRQELAADDSAVQVVVRKGLGVFKQHSWWPSSVY